MLKINKYLNEKNISNWHKYRYLYINTYLMRHKMRKKVAAQEIAVMSAIDIPAS